MKKVLINIILLFTFSISGMAQIEYGKTVEISSENSGLAYVHPVEYIREIIDSIFPLQNH